MGIKLIKIVGLIGGMSLIGLGTFFCYGGIQQYLVDYPYSYMEFPLEQGRFLTMLVWITIGGLVISAGVYPIIILKPINNFISKNWKRFSDLISNLWGEYKR